MGGYFGVNPLGSTVPGSAVLSFLGAASTAAMRSALGLTDPTVTPQWLVNTAQFTSSSVTPSNITGCAFTPAASGLYFVQWFVLHYAAATTTGLALDLGIGNATTAGMWQIHRGTSAGAGASYYGVVNGSTYAIGGSAPASPGRAPATGWAIVQCDPSPSADIQLKAATEVAASSVTIAVGEAVLRYFKLN